MQKAETSSHQTTVGFLPALQQHGFWLLIALATLSLLAASWIAWKQPPHPDAYRAAPNRFSSDFWRYPIEHNAFKRLSSIMVDLQAIHLHSDGQGIWIVGSYGLIIYSDDKGKSWQSQDSGTDANLYSITFTVDGQRGWVVGESGTILHTENGGKSWQKQNSETDVNLNSIAIAGDGQRGWVVGDYGEILYTENGGRRWQKQVGGNKEWLYSITFAGDGQSGWAVGVGGTILRTEDGGKYWQSQVSGTREWLKSITIAGDGQRGWAIGPGAIVHTVDGGKSWQSQDSGTDANLYSITFAADGQRGWAVGEGGTILYTEDDGKSWQKQANGIGVNLISIVIAEDEQRGWAVGEGGTILHTEDGGKSWQVQVNGIRELLLSIIFTEDGQRGWAVGIGGRILHTQDSGKSWQKQTSETQPLTSIILAGDGQRGWATGGGSTILYTMDGGKNWQQQVSGIDVSLNSIAITGDGQRGWAVGEGGTILYTEDGGKSWQKQASETDVNLNSIAITRDGQRGWVVGDYGEILHTEDGGRRWQKQASETDVNLNSIAITGDGQRGWTVGEGGTILHTEDGGRIWQEQVSGTDADLYSITFAADDQRGWAVGIGGRILHTQDSGKSWQRQTSGIGELLTSIIFAADGQRGWVVGSSGTILRTEDGGKNWQPVEYRIFPAPWFYVALVLIFLVYVAAFGWRAWQIRLAGRQTPIHSVSDHAATDRPASLGDPDFLGARRIAAGLTRFLTNDKTEPPLTLAITGDWGSGKSSLMNYLFASLKREGLRPVWFNAWHHREEQNVLASILAKVQQQAIKPWWHPAGFWFRGRLWWRRHLLWKTLMLITLFCFFFAMTWLILLPKEKWHDTLQYARYWLKVDQPVILSMRGFETLCPGWTESPRPGDDAIAPAAAGLTLVPGKKPQPASASQDTGENRPVRVNHHFDSVQCQTLHGFSMQRRKIDALNCITDVTGAAQQACFATPAILLDNIERQWEGELLPKDESLIRDALDFLQPDSPVPAALTGWIAAAFAALLFIAGKSMALLGLTSMQFFQTVASRLRGAQQPAEKVGTRLLFEKYFQDITVLLGKRSLVLFIDDLDRCDRDYTRQVLEVTNFLSSSGALFIVIGMAPRYVLANVTLSFQDTAKAVHEADMRNGKTPPGHDPNAGQSWFAQHYLQKLINIEVPVPKPDAGQVKALLKNEAQSQAQEEDRKLERLEKSEKRIDDALKLLGKLFRIALLLGVTGYAIYLAGWGFDAKPVTPPAPESAPSPAAIPSKAPDKTGQTDQPTRDVPERTDDTGNTEREIVIPAPSRSESFVTWPLWTGILAVAFVMLLVSAVYWLIRKQDALNDQRWLWLKPLLKRLKVTLFGPEVTQDTKDFTDALDIWYELIARKDPTPRNIKAFKNHLRYLVSRDNQTPENSREAHLVALATLFYVYPKVFDKLTARIVGSDTISASDFETQWPDLQKTLSAHQDAFGRLPSADDIAFYRRMIQDMQIHRPSED